MVLAWGVLVAAASDRPAVPVCQRPVDLATLESRLDDIDAAWVALDDARFVSDVDQLRLALGCAAMVLPTGVVGRVHRAFALDSWVRGDDEAAVADLVAAATADPGWVAPDGWIPDELAVRVARAAPSDATSRVPRPADGDLVFDGSGERRPSGPSVVQWVDRSGALHGSWYVAPDGELPSYPVRPLRTGGKVASVGAVVAGVGLYAGAYAARSSFETRTTVPSVVAASRLTNGLVVAGLGCAGLGVTIGLVSW